MLLTRKHLQTLTTFQSKDETVTSQVIIMTFGGRTFVEVESENEIDIVASTYLSSRNQSEKRKLLQQYEELTARDFRLTGRRNYNKAITKP